MKTVYQYLIPVSLFIVGTCSVSQVSANVDVTNPYTDFTYECSPEWEGILHTTFNLWGHHMYKRDYRIDQPGVIQIADAAHTTIAKTSNISISGCNYAPTQCTIDTWSNWVVDSTGTVTRTFAVNTDGIITKSGGVLTIKSSGVNGKTQVTGFGGIYSSTWKDVTLTFLDNKVTLREGGAIVKTYTFTNTAYSWIKEYYYNFSSDNKIITLNRNTFKKYGTGSVMSSSNEYDSFLPVWWTNTSPFYSDISLSSDPNAQWPDYVTGLNFWDYTQHYYTTTKVDLYPVPVSCYRFQYQNGSVSPVMTDPYASTLWSVIIPPEFSWPIKINGTQQQGSQISIYATQGVRLEWLQYMKVWEVWGQKIGIDGIEFTVKKGPMTLGKQTQHITLKTTVWEFPALDFNNLVDASGNPFILSTPDTYGIEIILYSGAQPVWTMVLPLVVVPNNDLKISDFQMVWENRYANGSDEYILCSDVADSFGNSINASYDVTGMAWFSGEWFDTDVIAPGFQEEWLNVQNPTFNNSRFCFSVKSTVPGNKAVDFKIAIPQHSTDLSSNGTYMETSLTKTLSFNKPFVWALSVITPPKTLSIGTILTTQLEVSPKSSLSAYRIDQFRDRVKLANGTDHEFQDMTDAISLDNNPTIDFRVNAKTDAGVSTPPKIYISGNPVISYSLQGQFIRYRLSATESPTDNADISLGGSLMKNLKVSWNIQGQGKQTLASQNANFSDISKSNTRAIIRKNAHLLIQWRTSSETVIGGVKYHEGDYTISWDPTYETLVVKNGNLKISGNFNTSGKRFGIIVLRDDATRSDLGNIYLQPGVRYIQSAIYADGGIISTGFKSGEDTVWFYKDSTTRTNALSEQLVIKGSLFTRNTIAGAIKGSLGKYILPGGSSTDDFNLAMMYDLNYLRRNNGGWDIAGLSGTKDYNQGNTSHVVIIYDANLSKNPPKGFKN